MVPEVVTRPLTGLDSILALDVLRKLAEEGVRVVITYERDAKVYRIDLEGGIFGDDETWTTGVTFGDAVETALDFFRARWADGPKPPPEPPLEFVSESGKVRAS
jgi:hypothetical protein